MNSSSQNEYGPPVTQKRQ